MSVVRAIIFWTSGPFFWRDTRPKFRKFLPKKVQELRSQVLTFSNHGYRGWYVVHKLGGVLVFSARRLAFELHIMLIHLEEQFPDVWPCHWNVKPLITYSTGVLLQKRRCASQELMKWVKELVSRAVIVRIVCMLIHLTLEKRVVLNVFWPCYLDFVSRLVPLTLIRPYFQGVSFHIVFIRIDLQGVESFHEIYLDSSVSVAVDSGFIEDQ